MCTSTYRTKKNTKKAFLRFKAGEEAGLNYFYQAHYRHYAYRAYRFVKEDVVAHAMA